MKDKVKYYLLLLVFLAVMAVVIFLFHDFIDTYSNPLMVLITFVYVVATVEICRANIKSSEATREQLIESKRQYEDKKRLEIMPYIQFERTKENANHELSLVLDSGNKLTGKYNLLVCVKNIGNGTAKDIAYTYQWDNGAKAYDRGAFPVRALSSGESQTIKVEFAHTTEERPERTACFLLRYRDLLENAYTQELNLRFVQTSTATLKLVEFTTATPVLIPKEKTNA